MKRKASVWQNRDPYHSQKGFTLAEVMIVVAIIGILSAIALPAVINWLPNMRLQSAARDFHSDLQLAKLQAIKTNRNVLFEINPVAACLGDAGCPGGSCYRFFVDADNNGNCNAGDTIVTGVTLRNNLNIGIPALNPFIPGDGFRPTGLPILAGGDKRAEITHTQSASVFRVTQTVAGGVTLQRL